MFTELLGNISHFTQAGVCFLCRRSNHDAQVVCEACTQYFEQNQHACRQCAMPLSNASLPVCGQCQSTKKWIDLTYAPWRYSQPLKQAIRHFKYRQGIFLSRFLGNAMLVNPPEEILNADVLVPMPIHPKRLRQRGYNQTTLLAKYLSKQVGITMNQRLCHRLIHSPPQATLPSKQRKNNMRAAFSAQPIADLNVVIIDDLLTTGATGQALAECLKKNGANRVMLWCVARNY